MEVYNLTSLRECNHDLALTGRSLKTQYQNSPVTWLEDGTDENNHRFLNSEKALDTEIKCGYNNAPKCVEDFAFQSRSITN